MLVKSYNSILASGTATGLRISAVDGTAFIDNAPSAITDLITAYPNKLNLLIIDSTGKQIEAWGGTIGTGETLDTNIYTTFDFTSGWLINNATIIDADSWSTPSNGYIHQGVNTLVAQTLYKASFTGSATGATPRMISYNATGWTDIELNGASTYKIPNAADRPYLYMSTSGTMDVTAINWQKVLTPSASGLTLFSTKAGAVQNMTSKATGFAYNESSYKYVVRGQRVVANIGSWIR